MPERILMIYEIVGAGLPVAICTLEENETMVTQSGGMSWMSPNMKMQTSMGGVKNAIGRKFMGESAFLNYYIAKRGPGLIAFASSFPGEIRAFKITPQNGIILQKKAFLAATDGIGLSMYFQKRLGAALWSGEGFILEKISGTGTVFAEFDGSVTEYELAADDQIVMDTGYLAAMSDTCSMNVVTVPGVKNLLFGGEGMFHTVVRGPGHVYIQSIPINRLAGSLIPHISTKA